MKMMMELTWSEMSHRVSQASSLYLSDEGTQSTSFSHLPSNHLEEQEEQEESGGGEKGRRTGRVRRSSSSKRMKRRKKIQKDS